MDVAFYTRLAETTLRLIRAKGKNVAIKRTLPGTQDPVAGTKTPGATVEGTLDVIQKRASSGTIEAFDNRIPENLRNSKLRALLAAAKSADFEPLAGDEITMDGSKWLVLGSTPLCPAEIALLYQVGLVQK